VDVLVFQRSGRDHKKQNEHLFQHFYLKGCILSPYINLSRFLLLFYKLVLWQRGSDMKLGDKLVLANRFDGFFMTPAAAQRVAQAAPEGRPLFSFYFPCANSSCDATFFSEDYLEQMDRATMLSTPVFCSLHCAKQNIMDIAIVLNEKQRNNEIQRDANIYDYVRQFMGCGDGWRLTFDREGRNPVPNPTKAADFEAYENTVFVFEDDAPLPKEKEEEESEIDADLTDWVCMITFNGVEKRFGKQLDLNDLAFMKRIMADCFGVSKLAEYKYIRIDERHIRAELQEFFIDTINGPLDKTGFTYETPLKDVLQRLGMQNPVLYVLNEKTRFKPSDPIGKFGCQLRFKDEPKVRKKRGPSSSYREASEKFGLAIQWLRNLVNSKNSKSNGTCWKAKDGYLYVVGLFAEDTFKFLKAEDYCRAPMGESNRNIFRVKDMSADRFAEIYERFTGCVPQVAQYLDGTAWGDMPAGDEKEKEEEEEEEKEADPLWVKHQKLNENRKRMAKSVLAAEEIQAKKLADQNAKLLESAQRKAAEKRRREEEEQKEAEEKAKKAKTEREERRAAARAARDNTAPDRAAIAGDDALLERDPMFCRGIPVSSNPAEQFLALARENLNQ
jgi:cell pole-organizing protein PopZ